MKKTILTILILMVAGVGWCQCVAEIKDVVQDPIRGSIIVQTQYTLNGVIVQMGQTRYTENNGTNEEIIAMAKDDIDEHCKNLIKRMDNNLAYIQTKILEQQKILTTPIIPLITDDLVGHKTTITEAIQTFKGKDIKVTYDEKNTVTDTAVTP